MTKSTVDLRNFTDMERIVEIDENERYWVGKGFGRRGLLPNDRGAFSTTDGSMFWKSPTEASEDLVLLGRGERCLFDDDVPHRISFGVWHFHREVSDQNTKAASYA